MTPRGVRAIPRRALARVITPPGGTALRDAFGAALFVQGIIRLIDGRLFAVTHLRYGSNEMYGALMVIVGVWLIATRGRRATWYGAMGATLAAAFYVWLAVAVWSTSATSGGAAIVYAGALFVEGRAWAESGRWMWKLAT